MSERPVCVQGDCLEIMRAIPDDFFDLVFCSPPYEDARLYGECNFKIKGQEWVDWAVERYLECVRVTKGLVCWVVEGKTRNFRWSGTPMLLGADLLRAGVGLRKPPAFHRVGIPGSGGPDWLRNDYEFIVCSSKGKLPWSDNTACGEPCKYDIGGEMSNRHQDGIRRNARTGIRLQRKKCGSNRRSNGEYKKAGYEMPEIANPGNVISCGAMGGGNMGSELCHENEAPFPERLAEFFIKSFCPPDGSVFDPFGGSGTTAAVAYRLGRNCFTCDIRDCDQAGPTLINKRLDEVEMAGQADASHQMTIEELLEKTVDTGASAR